MSTASARLGALRSDAARSPARSIPEPLRAPVSDRRAPLEVVTSRRRRVRRRQLAPVLSAAMVSASLFVVVIGHAELAQGQVRLSNVDAAITAAQIAHRRDVLSIANLENPSRILREAQQSLHMATPSQVRQLPHVSLGVPVANPSVAPAPHPGTATGATTGTTTGTLAGG